MVVVISVDAYPYLAFSDLTCHLEDTGKVFSGCTVPSNSKEIKLGGSDQEAFPSAGKNTGANLVPCCTWKCLPTAIPSGVDISEVTGCHLLRHMNSQ